MSATTVDEPTGEATPHIVINDADTLRINDLTQMGNLWARIITIKRIPAPPGTRLPDASEVRYVVSDVESNIVDTLTLTAAGHKLYKSLLPGDKPCRIIRRVQAGDVVCPMTTLEGADEITANVVSVEDDGATVTIEFTGGEDGVASIARNTIYAKTKGTRPS